MIRVDDPARRRSIRLSDGRALTACEWGAEHAPPVLFFSGAGMASSLGFTAADDSRLRVIAVDRPGLGGSSPAPGRTLLDWVADVRALNSALQLGRPAVVAFSQGAPFAFACAAAGVVSRVAIVAGGDELSHGEVLPLLPSELRRLVELCASQREAAESLLAGMTPGQLFGFVVEGSSAADRAVFSAEPFASAYRAALDAGFAQGSAGYARDTLLHMSPWPFRLEDISVPVSLWYGRLDASAVHSPDFGATLARRLPRCARHVIGDHGSALLWTCAEQIVAELLRG